MMSDDLRCVFRDVMGQFVDKNSVAGRFLTDGSAEYFFQKLPVTMFPDHILDRADISFGAVSYGTAPQCLHTGFYKYN